MESCSTKTRENAGNKGNTIADNVRQLLRLLCSWNALATFHLFESVRHNECHPSQPETLYDRDFLD